MAEHLNRLQCLGCLCVLAVLGTAQARGAERLVDPTRPSSAAIVGATTASPAGQGGSPRLQSVLISPERRLAVINGETVKAGDVVGDARVIRILETEVVLKAGSEVRVLRMYPDIEKKTAAAEAESRTNKHK